MLHKQVFTRGAVGALLLMMTMCPSLIGAAPAADPLNTPHKGFRIHGNTYFVGTEGLSSILIDTDAGLVLIDGGLPESVPHIRASIEGLGFKVTDVKLILSSDAQTRTAGGLAQLQRDSGADVYTLGPNEPLLRTGMVAAGDPRSRGRAVSFPPVSRVWTLHDEQLLGQGLVRFKVFATPGSTPGASTWRWESCEGAECLTIVYSPELIPEALQDSRKRPDPQLLASIEGNLKLLETTACDVLLTARPAASQMFTRLDPGSGTRGSSIKDETACRRYADTARKQLAGLSGEKRP